MALLRIARDVLPNNVLVRIRDLATTATEPGRMGDAGPNPYRLTFWYPLDREPRNVVEEVVRNHLHALLPSPERDAVVGVEWWLGRLAWPYAAHFEFGAHQDFGAHPETGALESPLCSSVFYLTTVEDGPLVVFRDEPSRRGRETASEHHFPTENTFAVFPGHLWHAILSCEDLGLSPPPPSPMLRMTMTVNWWTYRPSSEVSPPMKLVAADYDGTIYPELRSGLGGAR